MESPIHIDYGTINRKNSDPIELVAITEHDSHDRQLTAKNSDF